MEKFQNGRQVVSQAFRTCFHEKDHQRVRFWLCQQVPLMTKKLRFLAPDGKSKRFRNELPVAFQSLFFLYLKRGKANLLLIGLG
jgi:hypothetical protein